MCLSVLVAPAATENLLVTLCDIHSRHCSMHVPVCDTERSAQVIQSCECIMQSSGAQKVAKVTSRCCSQRVNIMMSGSDCDLPEEKRSCCVLNAA